MININAQLVQAAKFENSKNEAIKLTMGMLAEYNSGIVADPEKPAYLERLLRCLGDWITSHQPTNTATNKARWDAMESIAQAVTNEAEDLNVRLLHGPANWKKIGELVNPHLGAKAKEVHRSYWLEYLDEDHRPGFALAAKFKEWREAPEEPAQASVLLGIRSHARGDEGQISHRLDDSVCDSHRIQGDGKVMYRAYDDSQFQTQGLKRRCGSQATDGESSWSPLKARCTRASISKANFITLSFLAGGPVMAAGELVVVNGEVRVITAKSGHYTPSRRNMHTLVTRLVTLRGAAIILPDFSNKPPVAYRVSEFRRDIGGGTPVRRDQLLAELPDWAKNPTALTWLNHVAN